MSWKEQRNDNEDCYSCLINQKAINRRNRSKWMDGDLDSVKRKVAYAVEIPVPSFIHLEE